VLEQLLRNAPNWWNPNQLQVLVDSSKCRTGRGSTAVFRFNGYFQGEMNRIAPAMRAFKRREEEEGGE
jgi:hypothetical protein